MLAFAIVTMFVTKVFGGWAGEIRTSGATAAEFLSLEDDEVFVEGLQGGVGEAGRAVEDRAAAQDHVEPLEERAAGKAIEDGLLVEAAGGEVGVAEGGEQRTVVQALAADEQLGFHACA